MRSSVASIVCASATVVTSALLVTRGDRAPALAALGGGFATAAAVFACAGASMALRAQPPAKTSPPTALRAALEEISRVIQAGRIGDSKAAQHAFALIARRVGDCRAILDESDPATS